MDGREEARNRSLPHPQRRRRRPRDPPRHNPLPPLPPPPLHPPRRDRCHGRRHDPISVCRRRRPSTSLVTSRDHAASTTTRLASSMCRRYHSHSHRRRSHHRHRHHHRHHHHRHRHHHHHNRHRLIL